MHKSSLFFALLITIQMHYMKTEPRLVHREEFQTIKVTDKDDKTIIVEYNISQNTNIENNQSNKVTTPILEKEISKEQVAQTPGFLSSFSYTSILGPLGLGAVGCIGYALYYAKTKFNLYSLSKACVENALWSVWKNKSNDTLTHEYQDTDLMMDILQMYKTDRYAIAISHFLRDAEHEMDTLQQFIHEAESVQAGPLRFAFDDFTYEILEAKARISHLADLKKQVLGWLQKGNN